MAELEQMLTRLGSELDWPQTPELAARVTRRLSEPERPAEARSASLRLQALAGTAVLATPSSSAN